jgi:hypothetical protein
MEDVNRIRPVFCVKEGAEGDEFGDPFATTVK